MIGFMPPIYPDELVYSWFARYYAHSGHSAYVFAIEDLLDRKNIRPDVEFINRLNPDAKKIITKMISMEDLILNHTMFPYYRFIENTRLCNALNLMAVSSEDAHKLLPISANRVNKQIRYIKYCPICAAKEKEIYGESYWSRSANIRNVNICVEHRCRLKVTDIEILGKKSGRLHVADIEIKDMKPEFVEDGLELQFAKYLTEIFQRPIDMKNTVAIGKFLNSKLERTKYLSTRGKMRNITLLFDEFTNFYKELPSQGIVQLSQMQKIFTGYGWDLYKVCQMAYFLKICVDELIAPKLPEKSQTEIFNAKVARLYAQGLGCHRIARELGCSSSTARKANKIKEKRFHDYSAARKGKQAMDWAKVDIEMLPEVQKAINQIYGGGDVRPKRVSEFAVSKYMGWPNKRLDYLPECRKLVQNYYEKYPIYWAREVVWCYLYLIENIGEESVKWRDIRNLTNLQKVNFYASFPYLHQFTDEDTADKIKNLLPIPDVD